MSTNNVSDQEIQRIRQGLNDLGDAIFNLSRVEPPAPVINDRSLSGNKINGGVISNFASIGIKDNSTRLVVVVDDNGILTDNIDVETIVGGATVTGDLKVEGAITAQKLHVNELTADVRQERTSPLEFIANETESVHGKGLLWKDKDRTRQLVLRAVPDRIWSSEVIDLQRDAYFSIDNVAVLSANELGAGITKSNLREVGVLQNLAIEGSMNIDQYVFWNSDYMRLGIGTETPNGIFGIVQDNVELMFDAEGDKATLGTYTTSDLNITTDNAVRISIGATGKIIIGSDIETKVTVKGKLGVNVNNPDVDIATAGPVKFEGKKFEVGANIPTVGNYNKGDIVWNLDPKPTGYVGWICIKDGSPGMWKPFGQIAS